MGILGDKVSNKRNVRLCSGSQLEGTVTMGGRGGVADHTASTVRKYRT